MRAGELEHRVRRNGSVAARRAAARLPVRPFPQPAAQPPVRLTQPARQPVARPLVRLAAWPFVLLAGRQVWRQVWRLVAVRPTVRLAARLTPVDAAQFALRSPPRAPPPQHEPPQLHEPLLPHGLLLPPQPLLEPGGDPHQWHPAHAASPSPWSARERLRNPGTWRHVNWPRSKGSPHLPAFRTDHRLYCDLSSATLGRLLLSPVDRPPP